MKAQLLVLTAASLLFAGASAHNASASPADDFLQRTRVEANQRLSAAGAVTRQPVAVRATVGGDGRLNGLHLVGSSGSREDDYAVARALKKLTVGDAPVDLIGADLTLTLGPAPIVQAKAR